VEGELCYYHFVPSQLYLQLAEPTGRLKEYLGNVMEK